MVDKVEAMVDGGKATAGPPLGPALGPKGVNTAQVVAKINEKTKAFEGMKVPVTVLINDDKTFEIKVGNLTVEQAKKVAAQKQDDLLGATVKARVMEVAGNCVSLGVTIDGKDAKVFQADVRAGVYDAELQ